MIGKTYYRLFQKHIKKRLIQKERLNLRRLAVSSEQSLDGKLFVQIAALIFLSHIIRKMQQNKWIYTPHLASCRLPRCNSSGI